jgi:hypothetical protein
MWIHNLVTVFIEMNTLTTICFHKPVHIVATMKQLQVLCEDILWSFEETDSDVSFKDSESEHNNTSDSTRSKDSSKHVKPLLPNNKPNLCV